MANDQRKTKEEKVNNPLPEKRHMGRTTGSWEIAQDSERDHSTTGPGKKRTSQTLDLHLYALACIIPYPRSLLVANFSSKGKRACYRSDVCLTKTSGARWYPREPHGSRPDGARSIRLAFPFAGFDGRVRGRFLLSRPIQNRLSISRTGSRNLQF